MVFSLKQPGSIPPVETSLAPVMSDTGTFRHGLPSPQQPFRKGRASGGQGRALRSQGGGTSSLDLGWVGEGPSGLSKNEAGNGGKEEPSSSPTPFESPCSLVSLVGLLSGESEKQAPSLLIPSIIPAQWGRSLFN